MSCILKGLACGDTLYDVVANCKAGLTLYQVVNLDVCAGILDHASSVLRKAAPEVLTQVRIRIECVGRNST